MTASRPGADVTALPAPRVAPAAPADDSGLVAVDGDQMTIADMQARERWDDFTEQKYQMLKRTSSIAAPWTIVRSRDKQQARVSAMKVILNAVDYDGRDADLDWVPDHRVVVSGPEEIALMEAERIRKGRFSG